MMLKENELSLEREWFMKKRKEIREKYLNEPPGWIIVIIKRELNLADLTCNHLLEELHDRRDTTLAYWRQNRHLRSGLGGE
jgi:hypothetical protein